MLTIADICDHDGEYQISRERATDIAAREIAARGVGYGAYPAVAFDELYRVPAIKGIDLKSCWVVYAKKSLQGLSGSYVVLVTQAAGAVVYVGPAND